MGAAYVFRALLRAVKILAEAQAKINERPKCEMPNIARQKALLTK